MKYTLYTETDKKKYNGQKKKQLWCYNHFSFKKCHSPSEVNHTNAISFQGMSHNQSHAGIVHNSCTVDCIYSVLLTLYTASVQHRSTFTSNISHCSYRRYLPSTRVVASNSSSISKRNIRKHPDSTNPCRGFDPRLQAIINQPLRPLSCLRIPY